MANYLKNCWYAAAFSHEISREPFARTLLNIPVVIYRKESGAPVLLEDRCPHRFAPMSKGKIVGDEIRCGYHGLLFDEHGLCTDNPHSKDRKAPAKACIRAFPSFERYGVIWFWPGDKDKANPDLLPEFPFLEDPENYKVATGYLHVQGNYQLVIDNLLDLTHAPYVHPEFVVPNSSIDNQLANTESKLIREGNSVTAWRLRYSMSPNQGNVDLFGFDPDVPVDTCSHMTWHPPSLISFKAGCWVSGEPEESGSFIPQGHLITPETDLTCHYFFSVARNRELKNDEVEKGLLAMLDRAFRQQDEPMIEAVQLRMGDVSDLNELDPVYLVSDAAPVAARRNLEKLIQEEQS